VECVLELARCGGSEGVVGGQVEDLAAETLAPDEAALRYIHLNKTAKLLRASLRVGGTCAGASEKELGTLGRFGDALGLAFQIVDDILDETSTTEQLGKPVGSDRANAKMTWVRLHGLEGAAAEAERLHKQALHELDELDRADTRGLRGIVELMLARQS
jgi:geranylgeranyl diphosphate synthase, type II